MLQKLIAGAMAFADASATAGSQSSARQHGVIRGVVLDTLRRPASGVMVQLLTDSVAPAPPPGRGVTRFGSLIAIDSTDAAGRFAFTVASSRPHALVAYAVWVEGRAGSLIVEADDTLSVELPLRVRLHAETPASVRLERLAKLTRQRALWSARRPARYRLTVELDCFCFAAMAGRRTLEFHNDSLVAVIDSLNRSEPVTTPQWKDFSVPSLFAEAEAAIRDLEIVVNAIEYDPAHGIPTLIDTDTAYPVTDGWFRYRVTDFRPIA
jgi:hypothetical protein